MADARAKVLETMDGEVVTKLQRRGQSLSVSIPEFKQRLLMVAHGELQDAVFPEPGGERFDFDGKTYTTAWPIADENDWQFFRVNEGLGEEVVERAKARDENGATVALAFDPVAYPFPGQLAAARDLAGKRGWMRVIKALMPTSDAAREELLIACVCDDGSRIDPAVADKLLMAPSSEPSRTDELVPEAALAELADAEAGGFGERVKAENFAWVQAEEERLDRYAADIEIELDAQIADMEAEIRELQKQKRNPDLTMEDKLALTRARGGEDQGFKRETAHRLALAQTGDEMRHLRIGHRSEMAVFARLARQPLRERAHGRFTRPVALGVAPIQHSTYALPHPSELLPVRWTRG